nr:PREDICTED: putative 2-oxo-4-hydroxy-4-carboxy-5-ureidoimidazoline decarboxylase [Lepisosteus oculatus]
MDIRAVNTLSYEEFVDIFGNVVERCPLIAAAVWSRRPFSTFPDLEASIAEFIDNLPVSGQEGILRCHPDLAGRDLFSGSLTPESRGEQTQAGLASLTPAEESRMRRLNAEYKDRFGFPFVICARMNDRESIVQRLSERLGSDPAEELRRAVEEVKKICHLRLRDIASRPRDRNKL